MKLTKREKRMVEILKKVTLDDDFAVIENDDLEHEVTLLDIKSILRKLTALERKPRRVKVVKGWVQLRSTDNYVDMTSFNICKWGPCKARKVCPATLTISLPNVGKGKAK